MSIISDQVLQQLKPQPKELRKVVLHAAGRDMSMNGTVVGPVTLQLGSQKFTEELYVAPLADDMLLGLDFLGKHRASIHLYQPRLQLGGENISMKHGKTPRSLDVARVSVQERIVVLSNALKRITRVLDQRLGDRDHEG